jgi:hypothetical protein
VTKPLPIRACCVFETHFVLGGQQSACSYYVTRDSSEFNVFLFLLNALCCGGIAHSVPFMEEVGSYYMSLNEYGAPSRFHTAVRAVFLGLESFRGNRLTEAALTLDRPPSFPDLTPLEFFWRVYKGCSLPWCSLTTLPELAGRIRDAATTVTPPPPQTYKCVDWTWILTVNVPGYWECPHWKYVR